MQEYQWEYESTLETKMPMVTSWICCKEWLALVYMLACESWLG
jgi:hypothetical protein